MVSPYFAERFSGVYRKESMKNKCIYSSLILYHEYLVCDCDDKYMGY